MKFQVYIFGHHDYEPTDIIISADSFDSATYQIKWMYPFLFRNGLLELRQIKE